MYNVKVIKYPRGFQVRVYDKLYKAPILDDYNSNTSDAEENLEFNPFTGNYEKIPTELSLKRSHAVSVARTLNRIYHLVRSNPWDWFITLTFDPAKVDSLNYDICTKKLSCWLNNCRKKCPEMQYVIVPELHESGRYHFHGLIWQCDGLGFCDSGHCTEDGAVIYNIGAYKLGWTTATRICEEEGACKYMTKYITKDLCISTSNKRRYWASRGLQEAEVLELVIEGLDKDNFIKSFAEGVQWAKTTKTPFVVTDYYELSQNFVFGFEDYNLGERHG